MISEKRRSSGHGRFKPETIFERIERRRSERETKRVERVKAPSPEAQARVLQFTQPASRSNVLRDRRVPLAEIEGLLIKTLFVIDKTGRKLVEIERAGGPVSSTLTNWTSGYVRNPQLGTVRRALEACGGSLAVIGPDGERI